MTLGQKIKKLRSDKGLTQKDLADHVHVTFQTVSKWEKDENEPDVTTLRELSKLFGCSMDYLLSEEELEETKEEKAEETPVVPVETKTVIIHQKELHVCERCKKDIPEDELVTKEICVRHGGRGRSAEYRTGYYHKHCLEEENAEEAVKKQQKVAAHCSHARKVCLGWSIAAGVVVLGIVLAVLLAVPAIKAVIAPWLAVIISIGSGYAIFAALYCILCGSYVADVFLSTASWTIKFPGLIFSWDLEGLAWLIGMKILFAILGFLLTVSLFMLAIGLSAALAIVSFPFVIVWAERNNYDESVVD